MNTKKVSLLLSIAALLLGISTNYAQQPGATQPSSMQQNGEQAIDVVMLHYGIDPTAYVPPTHKSLPNDGRWGLGSGTPAICPMTAAPCLLLTYRVPTSNIACEWTVVLGKTADTGLILDMNLDAARYFAYKNAKDPFDHPIVRQTRSVPPKYPPMAKERRIQGTVKMLAHIDVSGNVDDVVYVAGPVELRDAAMEAARQWKYSPLLIDSAPMQARILVQITFRIS
jgi:TonB family protein